MTAAEARTIYEALCQKVARTATSNPPLLQRDGSWRFIDVEQPHPSGAYNGVVVRADGRAFPFGGALGKVFRNYSDLGAPRSCERFLGASPFGRYQAFDNGVAIWEGVEDIAFPLDESRSLLRRQLCLVAFFDLRGFTSWSASAQPDQIQGTIHTFEDALHVGFPATHPSLRRLFLKGTGDGAMVVSQGDWHRDATIGEQRTTLVQTHAWDFLRACEHAVSNAHRQLEQATLPLAVGCGIACGELDRVFLFGRFDFLGSAANEAAKLQQHAWNEVCVTNEVKTLLDNDGRPTTADWQLANKGWRLTISDRPAVDA